MLIRSQSCVILTQHLPKRGQNADTWEMKSLLCFWLFAVNKLSMKLSRISKPQSCIKLDVAWEVLTPVIIPLLTCLAGISFHICIIGTLKAAGKSSQHIGCSGQIGVKYEVPWECKGFIMGLITLLLLSCQNDRVGLGEMWVEGRERAQTNSVSHKQWGRLAECFLNCCETSLLPFNPG